MLTETKLQSIIITWRKQFGETINNNPCVPTDRTRRRDMYKHLMETLVRLHGYTKEELQFSKTLKMVMDASVNPKSPNKSGWTSIATSDWNYALDDIFPEEILTRDNSNDKTAVERSPEERAAERVKWELEKAEEKKKEEEIQLNNPIDENFESSIASHNDEIIGIDDLMKSLQGTGNE